MSLFSVRPSRARSNSIHFNMNENIGGIEIVANEITLGPITSEAELEQIVKMFEHDFREAAEAARHRLAGAVNFK
jgi:hypothetical protein